MELNYLQRFWILSTLALMCVPLLNISTTASAQTLRLKRQVIELLGILGLLMLILKVLRPS